MTGPGTTRSNGLGPRWIHSVLASTLETIAMVATIGAYHSILSSKEAHADGSFVTVSDPNNPRDPNGSCGSVPYEFMISKHEVSNKEYVEFLNSVASNDDPHGLYTNLMAEHFFGGIVRQRIGSKLTYTAKPGYGDLPVTFVSFLDAARYTNWLHYGRPATGRSTVGTTEGDQKYGAYDTSTSSDASDQDPRRVLRNADVNFWIPSCDEWVKAAFYDPRGERYRKYAFGEELEESEDGKQLRANYYSRGGWATPPPHLAPVTAYSSFPSPFGTINQGGNVIEWSETTKGDHRLILGGSLFMYENALRLTYVDSEEEEHHLSTLGFRVARRMNLVDRHHRGSILTVKSNLSAPAFRAARPVQTFQDAQGMEFVRVGLAGNEADPVYGKGAVAYEFDIARFEVTNREYADFLNAVAADADPFGLYHQEMGSAVVGGIDRVERGGQVRFQPKQGWERRPATYLSWFDVARFANWKHFGAPRSGRSQVGTTEGTSALGAYDTRNFTDGRSEGKYDARALPEKRNSGARYFIPSDDEWYKAAYYDPTRYGARLYWDYPTRTDDPPKAGRSDAGGMSNFQDVGMGEGGPFFVSDVGSYQAFESYFGTRQQAGNVWEWTEGWRSRGQGSCRRCDEWTKGLRGGSFNYTFRGLHAENIDPGAPEHAYFVYGARLARSVDERGWHRAGVWQSFRSAVDIVRRAARGSSPEALLFAGGGFVGGVAITGFVGFIAFLMRRRRCSHQSSASLADQT